MKDAPLQTTLAGDFRRCLQFIWGHMLGVDPTPLQYEIGQWLQNGPKLLVTEAFRGVGKTWVTAAYCVFSWLRNPDTRVLVVSASKVHADNISTFVRRILEEIPEFAYLLPRRGQRDSKISFDVGPAPSAPAPSMRSVGITGQMTGSRADLIIADDVETPNNTLTHSARAQLREWVKEFAAILTANPDSRIVYLGTPQNEQSIYPGLKAKGYEVRIWPARYPTLDERGFYGADLAPRIAAALDREASLAGTPTEPTRFPEEDLRRREASIGRSTFTLQFMLDTRLSDAERYPLRLSDLVAMPLGADKGPLSVIWGQAGGGMESKYFREGLPSVGFEGDGWYGPMHVDEQWTPYTGSVMFIDPAGRGGDETAYAVVKALNGRLFLTAAGGVPGGYDDDTLKRLARVAAEQKVNRVLVESNFGDGMFTKILTPTLCKIHPATIEEVRNNQQKEKRIIDTLEPVLNSHRLIVNEEVIKADLKAEAKFQLFYQLTRVTRERGSLEHDDRLDALAGAVGYWGDLMASDLERKQKEAEDKLWRKELEQFESSVGITHEERGGWIPRR